ncbi:MAG: MFS transporter [Gemmatimonadales bacterium]
MARLAWRGVLLLGVAAGEDIRHYNPLNIAAERLLTASLSPLPRIPASPTSPWAPLRQRIFRLLWLAVLISNIGTWMQTVGAQWLLVGLPGAATLVALVQTADTLPDVLLAFPAGALADAFDRRRLLIILQLLQVAIGAGLTALTLTGHMTPALLLAFTLALGGASAMTVPPYEALIPELVPREQLPSASALGAISINLARAIGPAIAGLLIARVGVGVVFGINTAAFLLLIGVLLVWRRPIEAAAQAPERFLPALRAGGRYVRYSPITRRILLRLGLFIGPATAVWALLPLVATRLLHLGSGGYGLLLGALGCGAVAGALLLPRFSSALTPNRMLAAGSAVYAGAMAVLVLVRHPLPAFLVLLPAGAAWVVIISSMNAMIQLFLPGWVRARGLAAYQIVLFGSQAAAALVWGLVAGLAGLVVAFLLAAGLLLLTAASLRLWPLYDVTGLNRDPSRPWPEPHLGMEPEEDIGPVLVATTYTVAPERQERFLQAMRDLRLSRLRTGAIRWELYRDGAFPNRFVEEYTVPSWEEHLRQHHGRLTGADAEIEARVDELADGPPQSAHLFPAG